MGALSDNWFVRVGDVLPVAPLVGRLEMAGLGWSCGVGLLEGRL